MVFNFIKNAPSFLMFLLLSYPVFAGSYRLNFDMNKQTVFSFGIYNPQIDGTKLGSEAENIARKNAVENFGLFWKEKCGEAFAKNLKTEWRRGFRSEGSEIFANGIMQIRLMSSFKDVFQAYPRPAPAIYSADKKVIGFNFPRELPGSAFDCNMNLKMDVRDQHLSVFQAKPAADVKIEKIVKVIFDGKALKPATEEDASTILNSSLFKDPAKKWNGTDPVGLYLQ